MLSRRAKSKYNTRKQRKKQKGGGSPQWHEMIFQLIHHDSLSKIGPNKPVATPRSTTRSEKDKNSEFDKFIKIWTSIPPEEITKLRRLTKVKYNYTINAYIPPDIYNSNKSYHDHIANSIIFYAEEYLELLAKASDTSLKEILNIIAMRGEKTQKEMDIIEVAFNDYDLYGKELSDSGKELLAEYKSLLSKSHLRDKN
jgi:hypothetical protein